MTSDQSEQRKALREAALHFHQYPRPGKLEIQATKPLGNQRDLALAYSPGVAAPSEEIAEHPDEVTRYTSRGNLVAVISNGTAVLGLGAIGALASKPVMEGKAVLFKKFAGIDVFDIEIEERDPQKFIEVVAPLWPTFGGINLEDIRAPDCFEIEEALRARMPIPVFHDDQHGTAIIVGAAVLNGLELAGKKIEDVKICTSGAGAAAIACLNLLVALGARRENIWVADKDGLLTHKRNDVHDKWREAFCQTTDATSLGEVFDGADVFIGLSAAGALKPEMLKRMADSPLVLALANPVPEIMPELAKEVRPDAMVCTGRSDYPNQVNNVLCFPFIFRGALDVGATQINEAMKVAAVQAIAALAQAEQSDVVASAYGGDDELRFGPDYLIPRPFDPRLITEIAPAVAKAAMASGVARRPIGDFDAYRARLEQFVYHSGIVMKPVFAAAKKAPKRIIYAEGEDERVLRAVQVVHDEGLAEPILVGRPEVVRFRIERLGLRIRPGVDFELIDPNDDPRYREVWSEYHGLMERKGVRRDDAKEAVRRSSTLISAMILRRGEADGMLCGIVGRYAQHLRHIDNVIGRRRGVEGYAAMNLLLLPSRTVFICDTYVNPDPTPDQIAEMAVLAAEEVRRFGLVPRVALLSHSSFGSADTASARKMRLALAKVEARAAGREFALEVEGEMHGDAALSMSVLSHVFPNARLTAEANLLVMPNLDAANIAFNLLKVTTGHGITVGPVLLGAAKPAHILTPTSTVRRIVNMTALAVVDAAAGR